MKFKVKVDKANFYDKGHLLSSISNARLFDEFCKIFLGGMGEQNFIKLCSFGLNKYLISSDPNKNDFSNSIMIKALRNTDERIKNNQRIKTWKLCRYCKHQSWPIKSRRNYHK